MVDDEDTTPAKQQFEELLQHFYKSISTSISSGSYSGGGGTIAMNPQQQEQLALKLRAMFEGDGGDGRDFSQIPQLQPPQRLPSSPSPSLSLTPPYQQHQPPLVSLENGEITNDLLRPLLENNNNRNPSLFATPSLPQLEDSTTQKHLVQDEPQQQQQQQQVNLSIVAQPRGAATGFSVASNKNMDPWITMGLLDDYAEEQGAARPPGTPATPHRDPASSSNRNHPWILKHENFLTACILVVIGLLMGGVVVDSLLGHATSKSPNDNSSNGSGGSNNSLPDQLMRLEQIWNCAHKLSAGHGFGSKTYGVLENEPVFVVSPQQKAVEWFFTGAGAGVSPPSNNDEKHCNWNTSFGTLYALLVVRGSLGVKHHSWFTEMILHNVSDVCGKWKHVTCDITGHVIMSLELNHSNLTGTIPLEIAGLKSTLTALKLYSNPMLVGSIPSELGLLDRLETLYLQSTSIHGEVPTQLGKLTNLMDVRLDRTLMSGVMPSEVCQLREHGKLQKLSASCSEDKPLVQCPHPDCCTTCAP